jgi:hypothetical protein
MSTLVKFFVELQDAAMASCPPPMDEARLTPISQGVESGPVSEIITLARAESGVVSSRTKNARRVTGKNAELCLLTRPKIGDTRWLLTQQLGQGMPKAFLALLVFWLTLLFTSFGLFAPRNFTSAATLTLCALAVAGAVGMILELEKGFGGLVHISPQPMQQAVKVLEAQTMTARNN